MIYIHMLYICLFIYGYMNMGEGVDGRLSSVALASLPHPSLPHERQPSLTLPRIQGHS
jgi:hypothetical protein